MKKLPTDPLDRCLAISGRLFIPAGAIIGVYDAIRIVCGTVNPSADMPFVIPIAFVAFGVIIRKMLMKSSPIVGRVRKASYGHRRHWSHRRINTSDGTTSD